YGCGLRQPDPTTETSKARVIAKAVERRRIEEGEPGITLLISPLEDCKRLVFLAQGRVKGGHKGWRKVVRLGLRCYLSPPFVAALNATLGEKDEAFAVLE